MKKTKLSRVLIMAIIIMLICQGAAWAQAEGKININTATLDELVQLDRIGEAYAQRIIDYREKNGPFEKIEDMMKVKGIGQKIFDANKERIVVE